MLLTMLYSFWTYPLPLLVAWSNQLSAQYQFCHCSVPCELYPTETYINYTIRIYVIKMASNLKNLNNLHSLGAVNRVSKTQFQVGTKCQPKKTLLSQSDQRFMRTNHCLRHMLSYIRKNIGSIYGCVPYWNNTSLLNVNFSVHRRRQYLGGPSTIQF